MRDKSGRFVKGYNGNAGGRPKDEHNIATLARSYIAALAPSYSTEAT